jgi:hypothetical protein
VKTSEVKMGESKETEDPAKAPPVKHSSLLHVPLKTSTTNSWTPYHRTAARKHKMASHDDGLDNTMRV